MRKGLLVFAARALGLLALTACIQNEAGPNNDGIYHKSVYTTNVNDEQPELYHEERPMSRDKEGKSFGYVRHSDNPTGEKNNASDHYVVISREDTDDSPLVTDEEVLCCVQNRF